MRHKKIITHAGRYHADELLAISTVLYFYGELPVERTFNVSDKDLNNPEVLILDVGKVFDCEKSNFDHHQCGATPATNILVLDFFCQDSTLKAYLKNKLFNFVDAVDRGIACLDKQNADFHIPTFNSIIGVLNNNKNGFDTALQLSSEILKATVAAYDIELEGRGKWEMLKKEDGVAIANTPENIIGWRNYALNENILLLLSPNNRQPSYYQLVSRDSELLKIPKSEEQIFLHPNGFMAVYPSYEAALEHALHISHQYFR